MMKTSMLLAKAKERTLKEGWGQHNPDTRKNPKTVCLREATDWNLRAGHYLKMAAGISDEASLVGWNDISGRTKRQVLATFDKAIVLAKQAGE